jgi:hypothetical protein
MSIVPDSDILNNLLRQEKLRLQTNSRQKNILLAALSKLDQITSNEQPQALTAEDQKEFFEELDCEDGAPRSWETLIAWNERFSENIPQCMKPFVDLALHCAGDAEHFAQKLSQAERERDRLRELVVRQEDAKAQ